MNTIENNLAVTPRQELPQLIKQSSTYKLYVPRKVEEKIRYLIRKFPHTEWSGVLFYTYTGSFENNDLEIHCEDLFPMDLGTGGWTEFKMTEDVTAYIVNNMELFNCETGLIHSHHTMGAFFSGQDIKTLNIEGNDTNCFVSLIVDTRGTYQAAITRKVKSTTSVVCTDLGTSYEFFGDGQVNLSNGNSGSAHTEERVTIEYFMLDVTREETNNPFDYLDTRFEEIESKKAQAIKDVSRSRVFLNNINNNSCNDDLDNVSFREWLNRPKDVEQPSLFGEEIMGELIDASKWQPDPTIIHYLCCQLLTSSLIVNKDIDLKQWVYKHMAKKYDEIFSGAENMEFTNWADAYVEFIINHYSDATIPEEVYDDWDTYQSKIAEALIDEIGEYATNSYIEGYVEKLNNYVLVEI